MGVNNGTVYGATFVDGQCGRALSFDGVDDYVDLGANTLCTAIADWSVSLRFKIPSGIIPVYGCLFSLKSGGDNFRLLTSSTDIAYAFLIGGGGIQPRRINYFLTRDIYYHCVIIYSVSSGFSMYLNTEIQSLINSPSGNVIQNNRIGLDALNNRFKGIIDNLQIFNRALTANEIKRLYLNLGI